MVASRRQSALLASAPDDDLTTTLERVALVDVRPHPRNYHVHPEAEILHLMASLRTHGVYRNVVIARDGTLLAGHGVVEAAHRLGMTHLPMKRQDYDAEEPRALQLLAGDNEIAREAQTNEEALVALLKELSQDDPLALLGTGFDEAMLEALTQAQGLHTDDGAPDTNYSRQVESPVYVPTGPKPALETLYDTTRTQTLLAEITAAPIPEEEKAFLRLAAARHTVFQYQRIAEYYAHAPVEVQQLMENSALVIIDFQRAIELGYVKLTAEIAAQYASEYGASC